MVFLPTIMRPIPAVMRYDNPKISRIADTPFTVLRGPPGSYVAEWLAAAIEAWGRWPSCVWLRTPTPEPARVARSLAEACELRWRGRDGHNPDHRGRYDRPADILSRSPAGGIVVLELRRSVRPSWRTLVSDIRRIAAERGASVVAVAERRLPWSILGAADCVLALPELWDPAALAEVTSLPMKSRRRLLELAGQRHAVVADIHAAAEVWPADRIIDVLDASDWFVTTLDRLTLQLVALCSAEQREALEICLTVGYWHPQLGTEPVRAAELRPWVVPLEGEWGWLRPIWRRSLRRALAHGFDRHGSLSPGFGLLLPSRPNADGAQLDNSQAGRDSLMEARLLGSFELRMNGTAVALSGRRGVSVLRYLLARRHHSCSRDQLIEEFWPDAKPLVARNRLQVAVSSVRRSLHSHTRLQVIEYIDGGYRINPEVDVTVDVEQFESAASTGRAAERCGDTESALAAYREAMDLYRGDFADDAPFEQWTLLPRESLRLTYLDLLDRMSRILFQLGRLDECIAAGHRMLDLDPCREDAYRMLMLCYARQGRPYQAVRQFQLCSRMLREVLSAGPAPETIRVYKLIKAGGRPTGAVPR